MFIKYPHSLRRNVKLLAVGAASIAGSFLIGTYSAGQVQPIALIEAGGATQTGDIDGDGVIDVRDAVIILEIAQGYSTPETFQLKADPNGDGFLTVDDAIRLLKKITLR